MPSVTPKAHLLFELMIEPCRRPLWTFLLRLVQDRTIAEDLYQETLLRAWRSLPAYHERGRFLSWLFRIAHNVVRDDRRRWNTRPLEVAMREVPEIAGPRRADERAEAGDVRRKLSQVLPDLTEGQRQVFLLRMHSDLTFQAIAELIEAPLSTVINRMRDALEKLEIAVETD